MDFGCFIQAHLVVSSLASRFLGVGAFFNFRFARRMYCVCIGGNYLKLNFEVNCAMRTGSFSQKIYRNLKKIRGRQMNEMKIN